MEEEWWDSGESGKTTPDEPKSEVIGNSEKVTNTLSEEVNLDSRESGTTPPDGPKSVVIAKSEKVTNTLSGEVNLSSGKQYTVWDNNENEKKFVFPSWAWFLTGLILVPIILLLTTSILMVFADSSFNNEYYSNYPKQVDDVTFNGKIFEVHTFSMTTGFEDIFATHSYWDIAIEGEHNGEYWNSYISGNYNA
ncbi:MAG: hypothetical protein ACKVGY_05665, partial [Candidatus Poseidoniales archaeon]